DQEVETFQGFLRKLRLVGRDLIPVVGDQIGKRLVTPAGRVEVEVGLVEEHLRVRLDVSRSVHRDFEIRIGLLLAEQQGRRQAKPGAEGHQSGTCESVSPHIDLRSYGYEFTHSAAPPWGPPWPLCVPADNWPAAPPRPARARPRQRSQGPS